MDVISLDVKHIVRSIVCSDDFLQIDVGGGWADGAERRDSTAENAENTEGEGSGSCVGWAVGSGVPDTVRGGWSGEWRRNDVDGRVAVDGISLDVKHIFFSVVCSDGLRQFLPEAQLGAVGRGARAGISEPSWRIEVWVRFGRKWASSFVPGCVGAPVIPLRV